MNTGQPWLEDRLYLDRPGVYWDQTTHGSVRPHGLRRRAPFHPIYQHYRVVATDRLDWCELEGDSTYYRHHWIGLEHRTGLPFVVNKFEDLFVEQVAKYQVCDQFRGVFDQPWNLGEEYRPDSIDQPQTPDESGAGSSAHPSLQQTFQYSVNGQLKKREMTVRGDVDVAIIDDIWRKDCYRLANFVDLNPESIVDIGAHVVAFSVRARQLWPDAKIVACEPDADNLELLRTNLADSSGIEIIASAVIDHVASQVRFHRVHDKATSNSDGGSCVRHETDSEPVLVSAISVVTLWKNSIGAGRCDLLKLDCEGMEAR